MTGGNAVGEKRILNGDDIRRALTRIAHEVLERNRGSDGMVVLGIRSRGVDLAERLGALIRHVETSGSPVEVGALDISLYRDDLSRRPLRPELGATRLPGNLSGRTVLLVADVLFTGTPRPTASETLTFYSPGARSGPRWTPSPISGALDPFNWRCWSTVATGNCRFGRTMLEKTCPPPLRRRWWSV